MSCALVWFRRDLRNFDHAALHAALKAHRDSPLRLRLRQGNPGFAAASGPPRRVHLGIGARTEDRPWSAGGGLQVLHGNARDEIPQLAARLKVSAVYANRDYEPAAIERDGAVGHALAALGVDFHTRKDQVIFEKDEVLTRRRHALFGVHAVQELPG